MDKKNGLKLTSNQEKAVGLLATGKSISNVAEELKISRTTLYTWLELPTVKAELNRLRTDLQVGIKNGIISLSNDIVKAFRECLSSENESVKLRSAIYLSERVAGYGHFETDLNTVLLNDCYKDKRFNSYNTDFDLYRELCKEYGIESGIELE